MRVCSLLLRPAIELVRDFHLPLLHLRLHRLSSKCSTLLAARSAAIGPEMNANVGWGAGVRRAAEEAFKPFPAFSLRVASLHGRPFQRGLFELGHRRKARGRGLRLLRGLLAMKDVMSFCFGRPLPFGYLLGTTR